MEQQETKIIIHMTKSHEEMASLLESKRHTTTHLSQIIHSIPDGQPEFGEIEDIIRQSSNVTKMLISYLNSLADLADALATNLTYVIKEMNQNDGE